MDLDKYYIKNKERYELFNKYNHNELIRDNYNVMDGCCQIYDAETIEYELNDLFGRLKKIYDICDDCLKINNNEDYFILINEIKKIIENSIEELSEISWCDVQ